MDEVNVTEGDSLTHSCVISLRSDISECRRREICFNIVQYAVDVRLGVFIDNAIVNNAAKLLGVPERPDLKTIYVFFTPDFCSTFESLIWAGPGSTPVWGLQSYKSRARREWQKIEHFVLDAMREIEVETVDVILGCDYPTAVQGPILHIGDFGRGLADLLLSHVAEPDDGPIVTVRISRPVHKN